MGLVDHQWGMSAPGRGAIAWISEPYSADAATVARAARLLRPLGVSLLTPPNPLASVYYPGRAFIVVAVRAAEAADWRWLPEQLAFEDGWPERRFTPDDVRLAEAAA
jgi:hypothetical protein